MKLHQRLASNNDCYKAGKKIKIKGIMVHSTGANNPNLRRYVGPDDGILGVNKNGNHWNQKGINKCVHAWIGLDKNKEVRTYQTLPWDHRGWHAGGSANDTHIGFEICEDGLEDREYFNKVYKEAVELCAFLCEKYNLEYYQVIDHSEGHDRGIASNHGDVMHWFPKHGKSMKTFRLDVKALLDKKEAPKPVAQPKPVTQAPKKPAQKTISQLADEVIRGIHGSGRERMISLGANYTKVQQEVNRRMRAKK